MTFEVDVTDNDMGFLLGKYFLDHEIDTFNLKDIDPKSLRIQDSCEPIETPSGPTTPWNCEDTQGKFVIFRTSDAKPRIHEVSSGSSGKSQYGWKNIRDHAENNLEQMCKMLPGNTAYCDEPEHKEKPDDKTSGTLGFATPDYAKRFAMAFRHAIELCGGKQAAF